MAKVKGCCEKKILGRGSALQSLCLFLSLLFPLPLVELQRKKNKHSAGQCFKLPFPAVAVGGVIAAAKCMNVLNAHFMCYDR